MRPESKRKMHGMLTVAWAALLIPALLWWSESVPFLVICSVYANLAGHWAAYESSTPMEVSDKDIREIKEGTHASK